jgi:hypothetical protein
MLATLLRRDGWRVCGVHHDGGLGPALQEGWRWDLIVCCYGKLAPIGPFWEADAGEWEGAFWVNLLLPMRQVRKLYTRRALGASVCFFSGAGTGGPAPTYSAYATAKVALVKAVELLDDESPDCKFFILGPGVVRTKIHEQTLAAGERAANIERVRALMGSCPHWPGCGCGTQSGPHACEWQPEGTSMDDIYACLMACVAAPKATIGGRNIYVPGDDWSRLGELAGSSSALKLRRCGDEAIRRSR